jgi:hypothetical protein
MPAKVPTAPTASKRTRGRQRRDPPGRTPGIRGAYGGQGWFSRLAGEEPRYSAGTGKGGVLRVEKALAQVAEGVGEQPGDVHLGDA